MSEQHAELKIGSKTIAEYHLELSELFANHDIIALKSFSKYKDKNDYLIKIYTEYIKGFRIRSDIENFEDVPNKFCWLCGICTNCNTEFKLSEKSTARPKCSKCGLFKIKLTRIYNEDNKCAKCNSKEINLKSKYLVHTTILERKGILR